MMTQRKRFQLKENNSKIFVRRGGPNHLEGLRLMKELGTALDIPIHVYGPETHMTAIVGMALGKTPIVDPEEMKQAADSSNNAANFLLPTMVSPKFTMFSLFLGGFWPTFYN